MVVEDAMAAYSFGMSWLCERKLTGTDPMLWCVMSDVLSALNVLILHPQLELDGSSLSVEVRRWSAICDTLMRASDRCETVYAMPTVENIGGRILPLYLDVVCGRGSAWLVAFDMLGRQAAGSDWGLIRDCYGSQRMNVVCERFVKQGISEADAGSAFARSLVGLSVDFDDLQRSRMWDSCGFGNPARGLILDRAKTLSMCLYEDVWNLYQSAMGSFERPGSDEIAWGCIFGVSSINSVFMLPNAVSEGARKALIVERERHDYELLSQLRDPDYVRPAY